MGRRFPRAGQPGRGRGDGMGPDFGAGEAPPGLLRRVVIVGGGTAGWITAATLQRAFNQQRPLLDIVLIESPRIGRVGVGEATIPTLKRTLAYLGLDEWAFVRATNATFKQTIRFENWAYPGHVYHHPFEAFRQNTQLDAASAWLLRRAQGDAEPFADAVGIQAALAEAGRAPKRVGDGDYAAPVNYAYQIDADLLAAELARLSQQRGVRRLADEVVQVEMGPTGDVAAVVTKAHGRVAGDLFVDCTGFFGLLGKKTLGVRFNSFGQHLLCDRAVAVRRPYPDGHAAEIPPYTRARALKHGWMWTIPLQTRAGHGYVYSSAFTTPEAAEAELRAELGDLQGAEPWHIQMQVGRLETSWVRNCVAIGLAGGFIEPLESTGIFLIEEAARMLVRYYPVDGLEPAAITQFNRYFEQLYAEIRDFVVAHYCLTQRQDTAFWRAVQQPEHIPERLAHFLDIWRSRPPLPEELGGTGLFLADSYYYVLYGMEWVKPEALEKAALLGIDAQAFRERVRGARQRALADLPGHRDLLAAKLGAPALA